MIRTFDGSFLNTVANHPDVRPWIAGMIEGPLDLTAVVADPANVVLVNDQGGLVFVSSGPGVYEVHSLFLPEGRGVGVKRLTTEALRFMFTATDCLRVVTRVPEENRAANLLAMRCGFKPTGRCLDWPRLDGSPGKAPLLLLNLQRWTEQDPLTAFEGHAFHVALETAKAAHGSALVTHPDDPAHDRAAGSAVMMAKAGQPAKAVRLYNAWAAWSGYLDIELVSENPAVIDVRDAVVSFQDGRMEVLQCR